MIESVATNTLPLTGRTEPRESQVRPPATGKSTGGDRVELSEAGREQLGPIRMELVQRIRSEIAAGTYLTEQKLNTAIDRMVEQDLR